jgi:hypothetical protein
MSGVAWALAVHKAASAIAQNPDAGAFGDAPTGPFPVPDAETTASAEAELLRAGVVDGTGAVTRQWMLAAWIAGSAPVRATAVVQSGRTSVHTDLGLAGGRGVGVTYVRRVSPAGDHNAVTEVRDAVEISFFAEEDAWAAIRRHLPEIPEAPESLEAPEIPEMPDPTKPAEPASGPVSPTEASAGSGHTIHLEVSAHPGELPPAGTPSAAPTAPVRAWRDVWVVADRLYSVSAGPTGKGPALAPASPGAISRGFAWRLLGAREYLASVAGREAWA